MIETSFVKIEGNTLKLSVSSAAEAKVAIKELRLKKKEIALQRKEITAQMQRIRAAHTHEVRTRGPMFRGGGGVGGLIRAFQGLSRSNHRSQLAQDLAPLEDEKHRLDSVLNSIDQIVLKLESFALQNGG